MLTERQTERIWLTIADPDQPDAELRRFKGFIDRNPSDNLAARDDDVFQGPIEDALSFRLQTASTIDEVGLNICAQGNVYDWRSGRVFEVGTLSVAHSHQGFGLQKLLMRTAIIRLIEQNINVLSDPQFLIFAAVADDNLASWRSIEAVGFVRASADHRVWSEIPKTFETFEALKKRMYVLPSTHIEAVRQAMSAFAAQPQLISGERTLQVIFGKALERYAAPTFYETFTR